VLDVVLDHRLPAHAQREVVGAAKQLREIEPIILSDRGRWSASGHAAQQGEPEGRGTVIDQLNGTRRETLTDDEALLLQRFEMAHHTVGRLDVESLPNLPDRGTVSPAFDLAADEVVDLPLARRQLTEVGHRTPPTKSGLEWNVNRIHSSTKIDVNLSILDARS